MLDRKRGKSGRGALLDCLILAIGAPVPHFLNEDRGNPFKKRGLG